ncbi:hypothetical protein [Myroides odoratus]|uniref:Uncharacterized protein n=1 Tax=Myroides odoratus TaxID=256 RepID=A0A378RL30_MYROD|nr:hypothetical protein [Myroides odoratus]QQU04790.1 hypothetical protein I6I89_05735 [Myroides odoratus]STZ27763.1 Uncharacterised protein [Myroides odoratus]
MIIELIPVIEIGYNNQGIPVPDQYPYWDFPELWDKYNFDSYKKAGFKDELKPYSAGSSFYILAEITDDNLTKLVIDHTQEMLDGKYQREQASPLFGGYVLRIDGEDIYFPQYCGDLSDIHYWEKLANGENGFYAGHPQPQVKIEANTIMLDFSVEALEEDFIPTPKGSMVSLDILALKKAIVQTKQELKTFELRLEKINRDNHLNIDEIGELLIWNDAND